MTKMALCEGDLTISGSQALCDNWVIVESSVIVTVDKASTLDAVMMAEAFGAGFILVGVPLMTILGIKYVFQSLKS